MRDRPLTEEDIAYIKANFTYDPETGVVTRLGKQRRGGTGRRTPRGYLAFSDCRAGRSVLAHRIALVLSGHDINGKQVDHISGDRTDNRLSNLRLVSNAGNKRNTKKVRNNTSGVMGVYWPRKEKKWRATISGEAGKKLHLGFYDDFFEAVCARKSAENRLGYHPNHGRR